VGHPNRQPNHISGEFGTLSMPNTVLVDTGYFVALFDATDRYHASAMEVMTNTLHPQRTNLVSVWPTVVEACFFLNAHGKHSLLTWIERGAVSIRPFTIADLPAIQAILDRYKDRRIDFTDACLIWLAGQEKTQHVLTTDRRDFDTYRTPNGRPFERVWVAYGA
jgi:predicted nucleic acid-binding protein